MDTLIEQMINDDPNIKRFWRTEPFYHFDHTAEDADNPNLFPIIDWDLGPITNSDVLNVQKMELYDHLTRYRYSNITPKLTNRGLTRKHQLTLDINTAEDLKITEKNHIPWDGFYNTNQIRDFWLTFVRRPALNIWLPSLNTLAMGLGKKVKITAVRDNIMVGDQYTHPFEKTDSKSLLSVFTMVKSTSPVVYTIKKEEKEKTYLLMDPGYGIVTSPNACPYEYKFYTANTDEADGDIINGLIDYLVFDIIE